ncbi:hypothetical protein NIES2104_34290 [Leptolyngbya sp. NIES-2104]|nr:hypothetical protein NIES2104_34290 [Leptolyngbya sp. NIES-2104]
MVVLKETLGWYGIAHNGGRAAAPQEANKKEVRAFHGDTPQTPGALVTAFAAA